MENKAFIFDMDGVLVNSEVMWAKYEDGFLDNLLGKELSQKIGDTVGISVKTVYQRAQSYGFAMPLEEFQRRYDEVAFRVYERSPITSGTEELAHFLLSHNFKLGLVSSSGTSWINKVLPRLSFKDHFKSIISLNERSDLQPKPNPDGYLATMKTLGASPETTIILEDSNTGITAAKASGAFTIAFTGNLTAGYKQIEADAKANTMKEVIRILRANSASA